MDNKLDKLAAEDLKANWNYPTSIYFGVGRINELSDCCKKLNIRKPLLVTDNGLVNIQFVKNILNSLKNAGFGDAVFSDVKPNPTGSNIEAGVKQYQLGQHDGVIALGGGSALDAGKAIALMAKQKRSLWDFEDVGDNWLRVDASVMATTIAIPTTAGTGSEVGRASVIVDENNHSKKIIFHPGMLPKLVIADPELTKALPPHITAATGLDAFVHSFEAYCALGYHPMADGIALESMRLIKQWLPLAVENGDNLTARSHMLVASSMGATAFQKGLGAVHALAHPLGAIYDKHHGLLNAILLPYVVLRNKEAILSRVEHVARILQLEDIRFTGFFNWLLQFREEINIPNTLKDIGINSEEKDQIGHLATLDASASGNPIQLSEKDYAEIFFNAVEGKLSE